VLLKENRTAIFSFIRTYFSIKEKQKRANRPNTYFEASQLKMRPKGKLNFFRPTNLKQGQISEIWPKNDQSGNPVN